ncbi:MAG: hypothetical protein GX873_01120 [Parcubacteria group bacterium]|jgi:hypothetical protein|nr:hypothetical protein [Parcubacteria group bacterium]
MQIKEVFQQNKKEIIIGIFVFLIVTISFALGYLTAEKLVQKTPIIIEKCSE